VLNKKSAPAVIMEDPELIKGGTQSERSTLPDCDLSHVLG
jgi:hypothetical protein